MHRTLRPLVALLGSLLSIALVLPPAALGDGQVDASVDLRPSGAGAWIVGGTPLHVERAASVALGPQVRAATRTVVKPRTVVTPRTVIPSDGKLHRVDIGGRRLAIWCEGTGSPTVILEHGIGYGVDSDSWVTVQNGVAKETRVCRYDRAWVGDSDDARVGRSMPDLAEDLVELMEHALIPGPYILVGHSFGGLVVRNFALRHPKSVIGMVLVDGSPRSAIVNLDLGSERLSHTKVLSDLLLLKSLGHIPLVVITRGIDASAAWKAAQADMVKLSTSSRWVIATKSDHWIQLRQPDLVIANVLAVLHTIRRRE